MDHVLLAENVERGQSLSPEYEDALKVSLHPCRSSCCARRDISRETSQHAFIAQSATKARNAPTLSKFRT